jgi:hypothetical protein
MRARLHVLQVKHRSSSSATKPTLPSLAGQARPWTTTAAAARFDSLAQEGEKAFEEELPCIGVGVELVLVAQLRLPEYAHKTA